MATTKIDIDDLRGIGDIAPVYKWDVIIVDPRGLGTVGTPGTQEDWRKPTGIPDSAPTSGEINLRMESIEIPKSSNSAIIVQVRGHRTKHPGIQEYAGTITLTCFETVDNTVTNFLTAWREHCWATNSGTQSAKVAAETSIILHRQDRQKRNIWTYTLIGCWLEDYDPGGTMDGSSSEGLKPSMTVSYDYFTEAANPSTDTKSV